MRCIGRIRRGLRGAAVVGLASPANHEWLAEHGAIPLEAAAAAPVEPPAFLAPAEHDRAVLAAVRAGQLNEAGQRLASADVPVAHLHSMAGEFGNDRSDVVGARRRA